MDTAHQQWCFVGNVATSAESYSCQKTNKQMKCFYFFKSRLVLIIFIISIIIIISRSSVQFPENVTNHQQTLGAFILKKY